MSVMFSGPERTKFVRVLRLLESDQIGEQSAAATTAMRMLRARGLDWDNLILPALPAPLPTAPRGPGARSAESTSTWSAKIGWLLQRPEFLTEWERDFVKSVSTRGRLSEKQIEVLHRTYDRVAATAAR